MTCLSPGENLLVEHEKRLETLTVEFSTHETIYRTIKSRNLMWAKWEETECKENDPNRYAVVGHVVFCHVVFCHVVFCHVACIRGTWTVRILS